MQSLELLAMDSKKPANGAGKKAAVEDDAFDVVEDEIEEAPVRPSSKTRPAPAAESLDELDAIDAEEDSPGEPEKSGLASRLKGTMQTSSKRPGEQDPLKSPLVLGLAGLCTLLVLAGGVASISQPFDGLPQLNLKWPRGC